MPGPAGAGGPTTITNTLEFDINGNATITVGGQTVNLTKDENGQIRRLTDTAVEAANVEWGALQPPVVFTDDNGDTVSVRLDRNMTINDMMRAINESAANVTISYDQISDRFTISSNVIGTDSSINVTGLEALGLGLNATTSAGSYSNVTIRTNNNGVSEVITVSGGTSNNINFGGVAITINENSGITRNNFATDADFNAAIAAITEANIVDVNISRNVDDAFENITNFINAYNSIISRIEGLLREQKTPAQRSYMPLTDEERQHMTDRQIEQWEEIARIGILRNDSALEGLARSLRNSFFSEIEGLGMRPSDLGLSTGNFFDRTGGQIFIDEDRLRAALEEDPDRVMSVFTRNFAGATHAEQGLVARLNTTINNFVSTRGAQSNTLQSLERSIRNVNSQIERMTTRMFAEEDRLFRQFAAMETAMSRLQSQGDWFSAMLGSM
jgi:flagellar hook-associated protein 2